MAILPATLTQGIARFFSWWLRELADCLPESLRARFGRKRQQLVIDVSETRALFTYQEGRETRRVGDIAVSVDNAMGYRDGGQGPVVARMIRKAGAQTANIVLRVPREKILRRLVDLPAAAGENLREVLGFEMDRHTPFKAEEVYFDYQLEASDPERKRIKVDLVVVPRAVAEQAVSLVKSWGLDPVRLVAGDQQWNGAKSFNLLPPVAGVRQPSFRQLFKTGLAVAACGALIFVLYAPLEYKRQQLAGIETELAQVRADAKAADGMRQQVQDMLERSRFVADRKQHELTVTEVLDELTRLLPDHTWALKFAVRDKRVTLSGYSAKPSSLIGLLEQSDMLAEVRFSSPVTMDQKIGLERFNLTAVLGDRGAQ